MSNELITLTREKIDGVPFAVIKSKNYKPLYINQDLHNDMIIEAGVKWKEQLREYWNNNKQINE